MCIRDRYITASIVMNLLTFAIPALERMAKEGGEEGKEKIQRITRYVSIILAFVESIGIMMGLRGALLSTSVFSYITIGIQLAAGSAVVMWMAEKITEKGIGNGMSLIIFVGIVSRLPLYVVELFTNILSLIHISRRSGGWLC